MEAAGLTHARSERSIRMIIRPAGPVSAEVPFRPGQPHWWPSPGPAPSPFTPPPSAPGPLQNSVRVWLDPNERPGLYDRLLTLDAEGDGPIRFELQNLGADLTAAITVMGVLDVVGVPVEARAAGRMSGAALGVLAVCSRRRAYPNAVFAMSEPTVEFGGTLTAVAAREEQTRGMLDSLYFRLAETTGREVDELRADARARRVLTAAEAERYGLLTGQIKRR
jgi:ATP-dependent Clp protease protease subunit